MTERQAFRDKIFDVIKENTSEKCFGCIHCKEDSEIVIEDMTTLIDELQKIMAVNNVKVVEWKDGTYKVCQGATWEYENDKEWLRTINITI